jgi:hypothetical protein
MVVIGRVPKNPFSKASSEWTNGHKTLKSFKSFTTLLVDFGHGVDCFLNHPVLIGLDTE